MTIIIKESWIYGPSNIADTSVRVWDSIKKNKSSVITFTGPLGAGKTTLIAQLLHQAGINEPITSPTFTYVNEYRNEAGVRFYHFDLYRLTKLDDFLSAGFDEYLYEPQSYALIEWPGVIEELLDHNVCHITLDYYRELEERRIEIEHYNKKAGA